MSRIDTTVDIARPPEEVFAYITDPSHLPDWQESAVRVRRMSGTPDATSQKFTVTRHMGRRDFDSNVELTLDPAHRRWQVHGTDGPVRPDLEGSVESLDDGRRSRVSLSLDFEGHGIGRALVPLVVKPHVRKEMPRDEQHLKEILERGAPA
ncbi:SRPBCC family protein [Streptomyces roseicoloratus]|uniref:SRPBCC family protein n=1 Tax=Streptomyces roseicoloratus TaxID=2508722 RepID=A0ABY9S1D2_9ACTN|nr:SRPBCC family protein [Streptomyces roseicoloratus]WMX48228.1 SRPBCC family protein [Streptomyces roseicoloratus]